MAQSFEQFYKDLKETEEKDSVLTPKQQIERLLRPGESKNVKHKRPTKIVFGFFSFRVPIFPPNSHSATVFDFAISQDTR